MAYYIFIFMRIKHSRKHTRYTILVIPFGVLSVISRDSKHTRIRVNMNECLSDQRKWCCFHPSEIFVGVCAFCLNERLLVLASKKSHVYKTYHFTTRKALTKIFALTTLLKTSDIKQQKSEVYDDSSSASQEDSFISIKFEDNGVALWDNDKVSRMPFDQQHWDGDKKLKSVVEHAKPRVVLRWQRRIGQLFQLIRWKRSSKVDTKLDGGKTKYWWTRLKAKRKARD